MSETQFDVSTVANLILKASGSTLAEQGRQLPHVIPHCLGWPEVNGNEVASQVWPFLCDPRWRPDVSLANLHKLAPSSHTCQ